MIEKIYYVVVHITVAQFCSTVGEILSIPADFPTSSEIKASYTSVRVIVIKCKESSTVRRSSMLGSEVELQKIK